MEGRSLSERNGDQMLRRKISLNSVTPPTQGSNESLISFGEDELLQEDPDLAESAA